MRLFALEHGHAAYRLDFALYGASVLALAALLAVDGPSGQRAEFVILALAGLGSWTAIEYAMHRFVLHAMEPFRRWHVEHHRRPAALICTPTILSATLMIALIFLPSLAAVGLWRACALMLGILTGYLTYSVTHHAIHHWRSDNVWLLQRKRWHALHHEDVALAGCFGVTNGLWDYAFGSTHRAVAL